MALSEDNRRRMVMAIVVLIVIAFVLATAACTSTTDESGSAVDADKALSPGLYTSVMSDVCSTTATELSALPTPPDAISRADWASEVARVIEAEAVAFAAVAVYTEIATDHRALVANTEQQADQWRAISTALAQSADGSGPADDPGAADAIAEISTEIGTLTLGRDELATEMGLTGCRGREIQQ